MDNLIGKTILGYTLVEKLGSGAYGTVYKAVKENPTGRYTRALKFITLPTEEQYNEVLSSMGGDKAKADQYFEDFFNEIFNEVQILNEFTQKDVPNVVRYYDHDLNVSDNPRKYNLYILMEYLTPYQDYLGENEVTVSSAVKMTLDLLKGLSVTHNNGVIHRDVKLDNIFVSPTGEFKIGDFGVSKILDKETKAQTLRGTPDFIAPEVYLGKEGYDKSVDVYSLGIVLYRLLNYNRNPFLPKFPDTYNPADEDEAFNKRMSEELPDMPLLGGDAIGEVVLKAISPRGERYQTADDFYYSLIDAVNNTPNEELEVVINGEGTPFYKIDSGTSLQEPTPSYDETVIVPDTPTNDTAETMSQGSYEQFVQQEPVQPVEPVPVQATHVERDNPRLKYVFLIGIPLALLLIFIASYFTNLASVIQSNARDQVAEPVAGFIPANTDSIDGPIYVTINNPDTNNKVYYTINGDAPDENSTYYVPGSKIRIDDKKTLRAIAIDPDGNKSHIMTQDYFVINREDPRYANYSSKPSYDVPDEIYDSGTASVASTSSGSVTLDSYIMGYSPVTAEQLAAMYNAQSDRSFPQFYQDRGLTLNEFCQMYVDEAEEEGVRADIAFAQAMEETGFLGFGGAVSINQLNFAGLGATDKNTPGENFAQKYGDNENGVRMGIRAQIQHLKAYASTEDLNNDIVDPRYTYVTRGEAPTLRDLSGTWAMDTEYAEKVAKIGNSIYQ